MVSWFRNKIITLDCIESWPGIDWEPVENSSKTRLRSEKLPIENIAELKKRMKPTWVDFQNETLNQLMNSLPSRLLEVLTEDWRVETENVTNLTLNLFFFHS